MRGGTVLNTVTEAVEREVVAVVDGADGERPEVMLQERVALLLLLVAVRETLGCPLGLAVRPALPEGDGVAVASAEALLDNAGLTVEHVREASEADRVAVGTCVRESVGVSEAVGAAVAAGDPLREWL